MCQILVTSVGSILIVLLYYTTWQHHLFRNPGMGGWKSFPEPLDEVVSESDYYFFVRLNQATIAMAGPGRIVAHRSAYPRPKALQDQTAVTSESLQNITGVFVWLLLFGPIS